MCFTATMSFVMAAANIAAALYEYKVFRCPTYSMGLGYFGLMELLQGVQHFYAAKAEDDYAMCSNRMNQILTEVGLMHIDLQPLFVSLFSMAVFRRYDIVARIEADFISRLVLLAGAWMILDDYIGHWFGFKPELLEARPPASEACPNYDWLADGYDGNLNYTTPNLPGKMCTYYAPTETGHLAWAVPSQAASYFLPSSSVHFFIMVAPYLVMINRPLCQIFGLISWLTGPVLATYITPSVHEQPAIWCFYSIIQVTTYIFITRALGLYERQPPEIIHHEGYEGEEPLTYVLKRNSNSEAEKPLLSEEEKTDTPQTTKEIKESAK